MPEITIKGSPLTGFETAVYLPVVSRTVRKDSRVTENNIKRVLFESGLVMSDDRIRIILEHARVRNEFAKVRVQ